MIPRHRQHAITEILAERNRQDYRHGNAPQRGYTLDRWMTLLTEEVGEVAKAINDDDLHEARAEAIHVAAVATAIIEVLLHNEIDIEQRVTALHARVLQHGQEEPST
jgi:NTP pyrophosphatase (non-canonical NTP hydrolase)